MSSSMLTYIYFLTTHFIDKWVKKIVEEIEEEYEDNCRIYTDPERQDRN